MAYGIIWYNKNMSYNLKENMNEIKVLYNFIDDKTIDSYINYINYLEENFLEEFGSYQNGKRLALQFGVDMYSEGDNHPTLDLIKDRETEVRDLFDKISNKVMLLYGESDSLNVCNFWLAKQYPGAVVEAHNDTDDGSNSHIDYSIVLYLNKIIDGGVLEFPDLGYAHTPSAGDLIVFPTRTTGDHLVARINEERYSLVLCLTKDKKYKI
jgi:hypothetical protein